MTSSLLLKSLACFGGCFDECILREDQGKEKCPLSVFDHIVLPVLTICQLSNLAKKLWWSDNIAFDETF